MAKKMELNELDDLFDRGRNFELTPIQYEQRIKKPFPGSNRSITGKNTPLRRKAEAKGYDIRVEERQVTQRVVVFTKREEQNNA